MPKKAKCPWYQYICRLYWNAKFPDQGSQLVGQEVNSKSWVTWLSLSQFVYFLREVCLLFNFWMIKFTIHHNHNCEFYHSKIEKYIFLSFWGNERRKNPKYFAPQSAITALQNHLRPFFKLFGLFRNLWISMSSACHYFFVIRYYMFKSC